MLPQRSLITDEKLNARYCFEVVLSSSLETRGTQSHLAKLAGPRQEEKKNSNSTRMGSGCSLGHFWASPGRPPRAPRAAVWAPQAGARLAGPRQEEKQAFKVRQNWLSLQSWTSPIPQLPPNNYSKAQLKLLALNSHPFTCHFRYSIYIYIYTHTR